MKPHMSFRPQRAALVSVLFAVASPALAAEPLPEVVERISPSVVLVTTHDRTGAGFFFDGPSRVVTAWSIVEGANQVTVQLQDGEPIPATVTRKGPRQGLAILTLATPVEGAQSLALREAPPAVGEPVWSVGHLSPDEAESAFEHGLGGWGLSEGLVSDVTDDRLSMTMPVAAGARGAPVFDADGAVFAVATGNAGDFGVAARLSALEAVQELDQPRRYVPVQLTGGASFRGSLHRHLERARRGQLGFEVELGVLIDRRLMISGAVNLTWLASGAERQGANPMVHSEYLFRIGPSLDLPVKPRGRAGGISVQPFFQAGVMVDQIGSRTWTSEQADPNCDPTLGPCATQQDSNLSWGTPPPRFMMGGGLRIVTGPVVYTLDQGTSVTRAGPDFRLGLGVGFQF